MPRKNRRPAKEEAMMRTPGFAWRVSLSIIASCVLAAFIVLWLFFYAGSFSIYQNIAVMLAAIFVFCGIMGAAWSGWGMRYGSKFCN